MKLRGRRVTWSSETGKNRKLNLEKVKWLVGGDSIRDYAAALATTVKKWSWNLPIRVQSRKGLSRFGQIIFREPE
jgi:hypothetical protein